MAVEFQPSIVEQIRSGETAALLLDAQKHLIGACTEQIIKKIATAVENGAMSRDLAVGFCHEIAAFQRILARQRQEVDRGRAAATHLKESAA